MKVLLIVSRYPYSEDPSWGSFNERTASALKEFCERVEVLAPRPYAPPLVASLLPRWQSYSRIGADRDRNEISIRKPYYLRVPRFGGTIWEDPGMYLCCRRSAAEMHRSTRFDVILSCDLIESGGFAWRVGVDLGIPASGWAIGGDVLLTATSASRKRALIRTIDHLQLIFYQSHQLLETVAGYFGCSHHDLAPNRHVVMPRGVPAPPALPRLQLRSRIRDRLGITIDQILVLYVGRIVQDKGVFELLDAMVLANSINPRITCVLLGSKPAFDQTTVVREKVRKTERLRKCVTVLPSCTPDEVWEYLCAADIFGFPSHREGMPNSLLEAMAMGIPAITFAIPPVLQIRGETECIVVAPQSDSKSFGEAIVRLAGAPHERSTVGERGKVRVMEHFMLRDKAAEVVQRLKGIVSARRSYVAVGS